jgi:hypothetical protein
MIQQNQHSIYLELSNGEKVPLLAETVAGAFSKSPALGTGVEPWQVEEMAHALIYYLRADLKRESISLDEFVVALSGLTVVCACDGAGSSIVSADLFQLAQEAGGGFELGFFQSVERAIQGFRKRHARLVCFVGLQSCVKLLVGAKNWGRTCQRVNDDIVNFIRSRMLQSSGSEPVVFAVAQ